MSIIAPPAICRRPAMNTLFEIVLAEPDENQIAAAEAALDEIQRTESVLSRFDPASEVARVNREAAHRPVLISIELMESLKLCLDFQTKTNGHFNITATSAPDTLNSSTSTPQKDFLLDDAARTIHFLHPHVKLDFGAFGKGFALDRAADILKENGVNRALIHGGTSSILALGHPLDTEFWKIGIRHPQDDTKELTQLNMTNQGFSTSATFRHGQSVSDIFDPIRRAVLNEQVSCSVIASNATEAEICSTAFLCMGKKATQEWLTANSSSLRALWIDFETNDQLHWLS